MENQRIYNKVQTTQEQEEQIRLCQKTFKRLCAVLKKDILIPQRYGMDMFGGQHN